MDNHPNTKSHKISQQITHKPNKARHRNMPGFALRTIVGRETAARLAVREGLLQAVRP